MKIIGSSYPDSMFFFILRMLNCPPLQPIANKSPNIFQTEISNVYLNLIRILGG